MLREFLEMVDRSYGPEMTEKVSRDVGLDAGSLSDASALPHILRLTTTLAASTGVPEKEILRSYGETVFPRLAGMHPELVAGIRNPLQVFERIATAVVQELRALDPNATFPVFQIEHAGDSAGAVECRSLRPAADLAEGLVRGCVSYCRCRAEIRRTDLPGPAGHNVRFDVALPICRAA